MEERRRKELTKAEDNRKEKRGSDSGEICREKEGDMMILCTKGE